jgi:Eukaryotic aspartyl protease
VAAAKISLYSPSPAQTPKSIPWIWQAQNLQVDGSVVNGSLVYRDRLTIHDGPVSVDQALAIANAVPFGSYGLPEGVAPNRSWDGVLSLTRQNAGLLYTNDGKQNTLVPQASWFDSILPQLRAPVIGIALKHQAPGFIDLGQLNDKMYTGDIQWASSNSLVTGYWSFHVTAYRIGTDPAVTCDFDMQINTGTKYTTFDTDAVNTFRQEVASLMGMETIGDTPYYKCGVDLPNITLTMVQAGGGSFDLTIPGKAFELPNGTTCEFGLKTMGADSGRFALGIPALQTLYVVLNASAPSIGFAPQVDHPDSF